MNAHTVATARRAHDALVHALHACERAEKNAVLRFATIYHEMLFRELGFSSIYHYAKEKLGFSESRTAQFVRLAKDVERLPKLKRAIERDEVSWTAAREVGRVATTETQDAWIARAKNTSRRELVREVRQARKPKPALAQTTMLTDTTRPAGDPPVHYGFDLTPIQAARLQKLTERIRPGRDRAELFLDALAALAESERSEKETCTRVQAPARAPVQVVAYRCESCDAVDVPAHGGMKRLSPLDASAAVCDAELVARTGRKRSSIPPSLRRRVLARDRHRCVRCGRSTALHVHHRHPYEAGGAHTPENCVTVCAPCHRLHHQEEDALRSGVALERAGSP